MTIMTGIVEETTTTKMITSTIAMIVTTPQSRTKGGMINNIRSDRNTLNTINVTPTDGDIGIIGATTEENFFKGTSVRELLLNTDESWIEIRQLHKQIM